MGGRIHFSTRYVIKINKNFYVKPEDAWPPVGAIPYDPNVTNRVPDFLSYEPNSEKWTTKPSSDTAFGNIADFRLGVMDCFSTKAWTPNGGIRLGEFSTYIDGMEVAKCIPAYATYQSFFQTDEWKAYNQTNHNYGFRPNAMHNIDDPDNPLFGKPIGKMRCADMPVPQNHFTPSNANFISKSFLSDYNYINYCYENVSHKFVFSVPGGGFGSNVTYSLWDS